jgi:hypothetical protein
MTENGGGKEKKTTEDRLQRIRLRDGWKKLKQKFLQTEGAIKKYFFMQPLSGV